MINPDYLKNLRPTEQVLEQCHQVFIGDPAFRMWRMKQYCREQNLSLLWSELVETSDVSAFFDEVSAFYFIEAKDATLFRLKFT
jgi:predicted solute-binding protein